MGKNNPPRNAWETEEEGFDSAEERIERESAALISLNPVEARTAAAAFERLFPADENGPGAIEIGVLTYVDRALSGAYRDRAEAYRLGLAALDHAAREMHGMSFADCDPDEQDGMISALEHGTLPGLRSPSPHDFFKMLLDHLQEGLFADPAHGGNRDKLGWRFLGHPGVWLENSAEECLSEQPVTKGGEIRSLQDAGYSLGGSTGRPGEIEGYDPQRSVEPPSGPADVVLVGMGGVGGLISPVLTGGGLRVVALEAGPWRLARDFVPDELGSAYYCRGNMGEKFLGETPRWRRNEGEPTRETSFSLGRMMNGVGGSIVHYGAWLRRYHPQKRKAPAQTTVLDDFLSEDLDYGSNGFVGGATLGVENQLLPIQISRQDLPPEVPAWGKGYKDHIREWQHFCTVRIQPDTLSYESNFLDLDPRHRDRSGLGLPLVRITYDLRENEGRLAAWMEDRSEEILRRMGATKTWRGPRFTGVGSSHDLGGCRMGEDPASSVVSPELCVHDTPGLYVFGGAVFPTCPGINPTHTLWALCYRAAERLAERLRKGEVR